jgi:hypothetical protein
MLRIHGRIDKLERKLGLSDRRPPFVHHIHFIDSDGRLAGILVTSNDPKLRVPYKEMNEGNRTEAE